MGGGGAGAVGRPRSEIVNDEARISFLFFPLLCSPHVLEGGGRGEGGGDGKFLRVLSAAIGFLGSTTDTSKRGVGFGLGGISRRSGSSRLDAPTALLPLGTAHPWVQFPSSLPQRVFQSGIGGDGLFVRVSLLAWGTEPVARAEGEGGAKLWGD